MEKHNLYCDLLKQNRISRLSETTELSMEGGLC